MFFASRVMPGVVKQDGFGWRSRARRGAAAASAIGRLWRQGTRKSRRVSGRGKSRRLVLPTAAVVSHLLERKRATERTSLSQFNPHSSPMAARVVAARMLLVPARCLLAPPRAATPRAAAELPELFFKRAKRRRFGSAAESPPTQRGFRDRMDCPAWRTCRALRKSARALLRRGQSSG